MAYLFIFLRALFFLSGSAIDFLEIPLSRLKGRTKELKDEKLFVIFNQLMKGLIAG